MSVENESEAGLQSGQRVVGVVTVVFGTIVLLAAIAYLSMAHVVNWVTVELLNYPVADIAPFVVISGAILTIPILIPTALVTGNLLK